MLWEVPVAAEGPKVVFSPAATSAPPTQYIWPLRELRAAALEAETARLAQPQHADAVYLQQELQGM